MSHFLSPDVHRGSSLQVSSFDALTHGTKYYQTSRNAILCFSTMRTHLSNIFHSHLVQCTSFVIGSFQLLISSVLLLESHRDDSFTTPYGNQKDYHQDISRNLLTAASSASSSSFSTPRYMRAKADGSHVGGGGGRVIPVPQQEQGLGIDSEVEPNPLDEQQQRTLFNSQSSNENERIDDGGDDQVNDDDRSFPYCCLRLLSSLPPLLYFI